MLNFAELFKNFSGMQSQIEEVKKRLSRLRVTGEAGAGMVRVTANGEGDVTGINIEKDLLTPEGLDMVEELIISATNDAIKKAREAAAHEMKSALGSMNLPGLDKLFGG